MNSESEKAWMMNPKPAMVLGGLAVCVLLASASVISAAEPDSLVIQSGSVASFALSNAGFQTLRAIHVRVAKIGSINPLQGEMTVGLAPAGGAVGVAKLHVFERVPKTVSFSIVALRDGRRLASEKVCGHLNTDTWVGLAAETTTVVIDRFVEGDCE